MAADKDLLVQGLRTSARALADRFDAETLGHVQRELSALDAYVRTNPKAMKAKAHRTLDRAVELAATAHAFASDLRGLQGQKEKSETASLFGLGSVGVLAIENVLTAEKVTVPRLLMSFLSEALMYFASRQYVAGSREVLAALYRQHAALLNRELWAIAADHRGKMTAKEVREVREIVDGFFSRLEAVDVSPEGRIAVLRMFYDFLLAIRLGELLETLGG